jgi:hypothetical protein
MHFDSFLLGVRHLFQKFVLFFLCEVILVMIVIVVFRIKISIRELLQKNMYSHVKKNILTV